MLRTSVHSLVFGLSLFVIYFFRLTNWSLTGMNMKDCIMYNCIILLSTYHLTVGFEEWIWSILLFKFAWVIKVASWYAYNWDFYLTYGVIFFILTFTSIFVLFWWLWIIKVYQAITRVCNEFVMPFCFTTSTHTHTHILYPSILSDQFLYSNLGFTFIICKKKSDC